MKKVLKHVMPGLALSLVSLAMTPGTVSACNTEPFLGTVCAFGFNFCPRGYRPADGSLLSISQNTALFSLLGTTYGGNGTTTFGLPDLRGRALVGTGQGPGLTPVNLGEMAGAEQVTLTVNQLPPHSHSATTNVTVTAMARALGAAGNADNPNGNSLAMVSRQNIYSNAAPTVNMSANAIATTANATTTIAPSGGGQPIENRSPYLGITYCVAVEGIFPSRN
ncbi:MAG: tail fiber protein [Pseudomonadota bacterium]